jgi:hypothetical protein
VREQGAFGNDDDPQRFVIALRALRDAVAHHRLIYHPPRLANRYTTCLTWLNRKGEADLEMTFTVGRCSLSTSGDDPRTRNWAIRVIKDMAFELRLLSEGIRC